MHSDNKFQRLICPIDGTPLLPQHKQFGCSNDHSFDLAKQGYINLLPVQHKKSKTPGDTTAMVAARTRFLDSGIYQQVTEQLIATIATLNLPQQPVIVDAGCGEGYYLQALAAQLPPASMTGLDISKEAVKAACRRSKSGGWNCDWIVASNSQIPLQAQSVDLIICIFGFPSFSGFSKILKPGGKIILVDPELQHLLELRQQLYQEVKQRSVYNIDDAAQHELNQLTQQRLTFTTPTLNQSQIHDLLLMTPHLFRATKEGQAKVQALSSIKLTVDMLFRVLQKLPSE